MKKRRTRIDARKFFLTIILPTALTIGVFILLIFRFLVPYFEHNLLVQKKGMIRELVNVAVSTAAKFRLEAERGIMTEAEARARAVAQIQGMRYGVGNKDYFWITDLLPRMIMHPYRSDLNGRDLSGFSDPEGKKLFVEMVRVVRAKKSGYVDYIWQWMDESERIVPKISYVREFAPWGWIIGTGIYIEDIRLEIAAIKQRLVVISLLIFALLALLLTFIVRQNLKAERKRSEAEADLFHSREKYKALVEAATEGTWMILEGRSVFTNRKLLEFFPELGVGPISDDLREIIPPERAEDRRKVADFKNSESTSLQLETRLKSASGQSVDVLISISKIALAEKKGYILILKELGDGGDPQARERREDEFRSEIGLILMNLHRLAGDASREPVFCAATLPIQDAVALMNGHRRDALVVRSETGAAIGIFTDSDLRRRVVGEGVPASAQVSVVMSAPLIGIAATAPLSAAWRLMERHDIGHVVIRGAAGAVGGILARGDIEQMIIAGQPAVAVPAAAEVSIDALRQRFQRLPHLVAGLAGSGARTELITGATTAVADETVTSLARVVETELGPAPLPFVFIVLGSEGRAEQTLLTDQDNALIFADSDVAGAAAARAYFQAFGERLNRLLAQVGYALCPGQVMAGNSVWNQPLSTWKRYFSEWIETPDPKNLLEISTFFDLRAVFGAAGLAEELGDQIRLDLKNHPAFFGHLARVCRDYKIPLGIFGKIHTETSDEHANRVNIKSPIRVIVNLVRLYTMAHQVRETNTIGRMRGLYEKGVFSRSFFADLRQDFDFLMRLQFQSQIKTYRQGRPLDHYIDLDDLSTIEVETIKTIFSQIGSFQSRLKHEFSIPE